MFQHGARSVGVIQTPDDVLCEIVCECHPLAAKVYWGFDVLFPFSGGGIDVTQGFGYVVLEVVGAFHGVFGEVVDGGGY